MRLIRVIWTLLALALVVALAATWVLTRPPGPEPQWAGAVSVLAGDGRDGWVDGSADDARFSEPFGLAATTDGRLFVSDAGSSHRIRQIAADGVVTTVAGGGRGFSDGRGSEARFATPSGIALALDGTLVVADTGNHAIRRVGLNGVVTTIAGDGISGYVDGPSAQARFNAPVGVAVDAAGRIIVADTYNDRIRVIDPDGQVRTLAGGDDGSAASLGDGRAGSPSPANHRDGPALDARFDTPCGVAVTQDGRVLIADTGNGLIRAIGADGRVTTVLSPIVGFERPMAIAAATNGDLYIVDERGAVVLVPSHGDVRLLAGGSAGFADGVATDARFRRPSGIALVGSALRAGRSAAAPHFVVADAGNAMVRLVLPNFEAVAGGGLSPATRSSAPVRQARRFDWPWATPVLPVPSRPRVAPAFDVDAFARTPLLWPVAPLDGPHEVAGTFGEARGGAGQERFHAGLDVRENQGTLVRAVRDGIVASPIATSAFDTLNESLRIGPLTYVHIRAGRSATRRPGTGYRVPGTGFPDAETARPRSRIESPALGAGRPNSSGSANATDVPAASTARPNSVGVGAGLPPPPVGYGGQVVRHELADVDVDRFAPVYGNEGLMVRMRAKRGAFFATGDVVGTVNAFNHVHLNVGWSGEEHNPLRFRLVQFTDGIAPSIAAGGVRLFDEAWVPLNPDRLGPMRGRGRRRRPMRLPPLEPVVVRGRVRIVVDAWDQADGNKAYRRLGLYAIGYTVASKATADRTLNAGRRTLSPTFAADGMANAARPTQVFDRMRREADAAKRVYATGSGIPVYGASRTQFLYVATTSYHDGLATEGFWDTTTMAPGEHVLRVFVQDFSGNTTSRDLRVVVVP